MAVWRTQARTALSVRSSSWATTPIDFPLSPTSRTVRALNSSVNARRFRLAMDHSYRTFVRSAVSTKPGQDQFVVLQGSTAVLQERQSAKKWPYVIALRDKLIADGTLVQKNGFYLFTRDVEFSSPSAAASVIEGGSANGLIEWRTKDGRVLKELDEQA